LFDIEFSLFEKFVTGKRNDVRASQIRHEWMSQRVFEHPARPEVRTWLDQIKFCDYGRSSGAAWPGACFIMANMDANITKLPFKLLQRLRYLLKFIEGDRH